MKKVAVILSGCGVYDGAEIHESVLTLLSILKHGGSYQCFAPDKPQLHVVNHLTGEVVEGESRNVLAESARITRGKVKPVTECNADDFDLLILPGGFGAAKNLCTFAIDGPDCQFDEDVLSVCKAFAEAGKPAAYACIAPALAAKVYGTSVNLTIGNDEGTASALEQFGVKHQNCTVTDVVIDQDAKLVTTPAYMLGQNMLEVAEGLDKMVQAVFALK
ncbi:isoprenoid biosynthesis glyoxalase ElbB [Alteromonas lipolytica]|uniref:Glyoxalase n=1 Tax=Alteromonas lipolytica TaxID=1856405 RepID=A0A1E8FCA6_9ALTE|nr:isoprenoid biosynthesis glyoxalase ElbB [Alteromonas lipolytica]OFI33562.1 isoprenoid biosynthesis protein ElbB [Alteromonas lipolytica]